MNQIKFAIVGCGRIAQRHAEHISKIGKLVAVCDVVESRAEALGKKYSCNYYNSLDELFAKEVNINVVSICTPNGLHAEHSIKSLRAGINVLVEKPMALRTVDCERMIHEAEAANKRLFIVKQNRFNPPIQKLKELIDENILGTIYSIQLNCFWNRNDDYYHNSDWKGTMHLDGGILFTQFSHFIDLLYWLFGDVVETFGYKNNYAHKSTIEFEDAGVVVIKLYDGIIGTINYTINSYNKNYEGSLTIFAEKGTIKIGGEYLNVIDYHNIKNYSIEKLPDSDPANDYGTYKGSMSNHDKVYENVVDVLQNGGVIKTNMLDGLKTVQIIERICKNLE